MPAAIGSPGMDSTGAAMSRGGGGSAAGSAAGQSPAPSMIDQNAMAGAAGFGAQNDMLTQTMTQIRQLGEGVKALATLIPMGADEITQIQNLLKALVVKAAQGAPQQTPSGMSVPGGGGSGQGLPAGAGAPPPQ